MTAEPIPLIVRKVIAAPRARIFAAFSRAESLSRWFTPSQEIAIEVLAFEFASGGPFRFRYSMPDGRRPVVGGIYEAIETPERIACTWVWQAPDPLADVPMRVVFNFLEKCDGTEIVIAHHGIPSDQVCSIHEDGWDRALASLEDYVRETSPQELL